jgi:hypothetical protein
MAFSKSGFVSSFNNLADRRVNPLNVVSPSCSEEKINCPENDKDEDRIEDDIPE